MTSCGPGWLVVVRPELKDRFKERVSIRSRDALWFHIVFDPVPAAIEMSDTIGQCLQDWSGKYTSSSEPPYDSCDDS